VTLTHPDRAVPIETFGDLALDDGNDDVFFERHVGRLDGALRRITRRLALHLDRRAIRQAEYCADLLAALPDQDRRSLITHPYYMRWLSAQYEHTVAGRVADLEQGLRDAARFVLLPALRHGLWDGAPLTVSAPAGQVRFPGARRHILLPEGTRLGSVELSAPGDGTLWLRHGDWTADVVIAQLAGDHPISGGSPLWERPVIPGTSIEVDGTDPAVTELFRSINAKPPMENYPPRDLVGRPAVSPATLDHLAAAYRLLELAWPAVIPELNRYTRLVVPFLSRCYSTFTEAVFLGAVFMGECRKPFADPLFTAEHLLHEHSHLRMALIMEVDQLYSVPGDQVFRSPWRRDPRPLLGLVQGAFVFGRVARFLRLAYRLDRAEPVARRHAEVTSDLREALAVLSGARDVTFTALGRHLLGQLEREAGTPVDGMEA
jgi:HEXXH motif-containing protein